MNEITDFMSKFNANIETKWGLAFDPNLGKKIKITIIASGFGLFGNAKQVAPQQQTISEEEALEREEQRNKY